MQKMSTYRSVVPRLGAAKSLIGRKRTANAVKYKCMSSTFVHSTKVEAVQVTCQTSCIMTRYLLAAASQLSTSSLTEPFPVILGIRSVV
jgi:hypothetical protein